MDTPTAQGTDGQPTNGHDAKTGQDNEGFQKRIDELTAARHQSDQRAAQLEDTLTQQAALMADLTSKLAGTIPQPERERTEIDPEIAKQVQAIVDPLIKRVEAGLGAVAGKLGTAEQREVEEVVGDPEISRQAKALQQQYARQGVNAEFATCVDILLGQRFRAEKVKSARTDAARRAGNAGYNVMTGTGAPALGAAVPGPGAVHPASKFTPEYLNTVGMPGGPTAKQLDQEMAKMSALPLKGVIRE